jgi:hypothetical protein
MALVTRLIASMMDLFSFMEKLTWFANIEH